MKAEGKEKEFPTLGIALKTYKGENLQGVNKTPGKFVLLCVLRFNSCFVSLTNNC